jgi:transglutaminase-like putative cysteine protease
MTPRIRYQVVHETHYEYLETVLSSHHLAHLTPRDCNWQSRLDHRLEISPLPRELSTGTDYFGNGITRFFVDQPHDTLTVRAESVVEVASQMSGPASASPAWELATRPPLAGSAADLVEIEQFRIGSPMAPILDDCAAYAMGSFEPGRPWLEAATELTRRIQAEFRYDATATTVTTRVAEVMERRVGVCQDFAHLMISCLRSIGIPARYVSGYVLTRPAAGHNRLTGTDASHAWVSAYCPQIGWLAFDPTNGKLADTEFVTLGWGREFSDVTPLRGVMLGSQTQQLSVAVSVTPMSSDTAAPVTSGAVAATGER